MIDHPLATRKVAFTLDIVQGSDIVRSCFGEASSVRCRHKQQTVRPREGLSSVFDKNMLRV